MILARFPSVFAFGQLDLKPSTEPSKKSLKAQKLGSVWMQVCGVFFSEGKREQTNPFQMFCRLNEEPFEWRLMCEFKEGSRKGHPEQ